MLIAYISAIHTSFTTFTHLISMPLTSFKNDIYVQRVVSDIYNMVCYGFRGDCGINIAKLEQCRGMLLFLNSGKDRIANSRA